MWRSNVTRTDSAVRETKASRVYDTNAVPSAFSSISPLTELGQCPHRSDTVIQ